MSHKEVTIEVGPECISKWRESWAKRTARVTLLVDFKKQFAIVVDTSHGFWFLPGGGVEQNESVEEAARREAVEELGLEVKVNKIIKTYRVTLSSVRRKDELEIPPFIAVHVTCIGGQLKTGYAPNRKILLARGDECQNLLLDFEVPKEYEWMKPYFYVSKDVIKEFTSINSLANRFKRLGKIKNRPNLKSIFCSPTLKTSEN
jgi:8-oxo-dGTP pyrophosphatase MutT (NUDIX family)